LAWHPLGCGTHHVQEGPSPRCDGVQLPALSEATDCHPNQRSRSRRWSDLPQQENGMVAAAGHGREQGTLFSTA